MISRTGTCFSVAIMHLPCTSLECYFMLIMMAQNKAQGTFAIKYENNKRCFELKSTLLLYINRYPNPQALCCNCELCGILLKKFALLLTKRRLQPPHEMISNTKLWPRSVQRLYHQFHVTVQEEWSRITVLVAKVDNAVNSTTIITRSPLMDKIADVDNVRVWCYWNRHPAFCRGVKDFKALRSGLLK